MGRLRLRENDPDDEEEPMITGMHTVVFSKDAEADRAFFRDVLGFRHVDAGHGWLIFGMRGGEAAFHPSDGNDVHQLHLMCDDLAAEMASLAEKGVDCAEVEEQPWGSLTSFALPGGGRIALYQPRHETALDLY